MSRLPSISNGQPLPLGDVPLLDFSAFQRSLLDGLNGHQGRLSALFGQPAGDHIRLFAVIARPDKGQFIVTSTLVDDSYPSLSLACPQAHWFEREIAEQWGVRPEGHPWLKPIRFHRSYRPGKDAWERPTDDPLLPSVTNYFQVQGEEVHEVAVGPVHAGVIEPGSFRFQCHGEWVYHLEISLGYQHRGVENALRGGPNKRTIHLMETLAGDTSLGHATAYCQVLEGLAGCEPPLRAQAIRGIALELERLANHTGDLGALAGDVGFLPTQSFCGRLRGDFLNATAAICGNRFGRSLVRPGGVGFDVDTALARSLRERLAPALRDVSGAVELLWASSSVMARLETTGAVAQRAALDVGLVGVAARACGVEVDARHDFPSGIFRFVQIPVSASPSGDVFARAYVRWLEIQRSGEFVMQQLKTLADAASPSPLALRSTVGLLRPESLVVSVGEGWRGEVCHVAATDTQGRFQWYKVVDPSFHNWFGLALALRNQQISDFPLCNKSFNLSYCGHDL